MFGKGTSDIMAEVSGPSLILMVSKQPTYRQRQMTSDRYIALEFEGKELEESV